MDRTNVGKNELEKLEPRLRPRLMRSFLDQEVQLRIAHSRCVESPESAKGFAAVNYGVEEWGGVGNVEVPGEKKELVLGRFQSVVKDSY